jgi:hypothetical protein
MDQPTEQQALLNAVAEVGYLHADFTVEPASSKHQQSDHAYTPDRIVIVRNELTHTSKAYACGRDRAWLGEFRRDLTAGAFN